MIPTRASRMVHFFDPSSEKMRFGRVPRMLSEVDILLGNLEDAIPVERKEAAREGLRRPDRSARMPLAGRVVCPRLRRIDTQL